MTKHREMWATFSVHPSQNNTKAIRTLKEAPAMLALPRLIANGYGSWKPPDERDREKLARILDALGVQDALWCLRAMDDARLIGIIAGRITLRVVPIYEARFPGDLRVRRAAELAPAARPRPRNCAPPTPPLTPPPRAPPLPPERRPCRPERRGRGAV